MAFTFIGPTDDGRRGQVPGSWEDVRNQMNILVNEWANPAERIMSLLYLSFQNTALEQEQASADVETAIRGCSSMKKIRTKKRQEIT